MSDCIFCKIIKGELPCFKVYEDEICIAFLDIHPINTGHTLVIPKRHVARSFELKDDEAGHLFKIAKNLYTALRKTDVKSEGANFFLSDGKVAGQEVEHAHLHFVPRFSGDHQSLGFVRIKDESNSAAFFNETASKLREKYKEIK